MFEILCKLYEVKFFLLFVAATIVIVLSDFILTKGCNND